MFNILFLLLVRWFFFKKLNSPRSFTIQNYDSENTNVRIFFY